MYFCDCKSFCSVYLGALYYVSLLKQNFSVKSFCEHCYANIKLNNFWILFKQLKVISYFYIRGYAMIYICQNGWSQNFGTPTKCRYKYLLCIISVLIQIMRVSKQNFIHKEVLVYICTLWVSTKTISVWGYSRLYNEAWSAMPKACIISMYEGTILFVFNKNVTMLKDDKHWKIKTLTL